jgi:hypothetical protein
MLSATSCEKPLARKKKLVVAHETEELLQSTKMFSCQQQ